MKKQKLTEWAREREKTAKEDKWLDEEQAAKEKYDIFTYQVHKDGRIEHETKHKSEAIGIAKNINAMVILCIEGTGLYRVWPED